MTFYLLKLALTVHIAGLTIAGGLSLANFLVLQKFRKVYFSNEQRALVILEGNAKLPGIANIGIVISVISGIAMMILTDGVFMKQLWFEIKLGLLIIIILNIIWRSSLKTKLKKDFIENRAEATMKIRIVELTNLISVSVLMQLILFLSIFFLAAFRFN